jgi:hypothetical protein
LKGIHPNELVLKLKNRIPTIQHNKLAIVTDEYLQVKGFDSIYAVGECATIDQKKLLEKWKDVFITLDANNDGFIDPEEFTQLTQQFR